MNRLFVITVCHMPPEIIAMSLVKFKMTNGVPDKYIHSWVMVDNVWPIDRHKTREVITDLAPLVDAEIIRCQENIGGHAGFSRGVDYIRAMYGLGTEDLVLLYDPDSYPITPNWLESMVAVMSKDPTLGYVSLMDTRIVGNRDWRIERFTGHNVAFTDQPDMFNVTLFRGIALGLGLQAEKENKYYGNVETAMSRHVKSLGLRHGYLRDVYETQCPIPHPQLYTDWKRKHGGERSYPGNFCDYVKEFGDVRP